MNPFAAIPLDERYREFHERYPALNLIGNTRMVEILCFKEELPEVSIYAKAEYANPGGSLKDRPVRRMLLEALIAGKIGKGQIVLDSSSGNAGIAYAMIGAMMKIPIQIVVPGNASKERKMRIAAHGATLADAVKQVVYVTDVRYQADVAKCRREAYGDGPIPANTFLVISALAIPGMLLEIDVTAVVGK